DLGGGGVVDVDVRGAGDVRESFGRQLPGAAVDEVERDRQPGEDPRALVADVPDPEDRARRARPHRLEEDGDLPAAALGAVDRGRVLGEGQDDLLGRVRPGGEQLAGPVDERRLEVAAADAVPRTVRGDDHLRARLAGGVPADLDDGDEHRRLTAGAQLLERGQPVHRPAPASTGSAAAADRASSTAQNTASGVAGLGSRTSRPAGPNAATAARRASRADSASLSGGAPTAWEP